MVVKARKAPRHIMLYKVTTSLSCFFAKAGNLLLFFCQGGGVYTFAPENRKLVCWLLFKQCYAFIRDVMIAMIMMMGWSLLQKKRKIVPVLSSCLVRKPVAGTVVIIILCQL